MTKQQRPPILAAYDRVIIRVREIHKEKHGHERGALAWFGAQLGTSRQTVENWSRRMGIPEDRVSKVARITGLSPEAVRPKTVCLEGPTDVWRAMCASNPDITSQFIEHPSKRRRHG